MKIKAKWIAAIVYAVSVVLVSGILFSLIEENDYFWVTYAFTLVALSVVFAVIFYYLSDAKRTFKQFPANAPYAYVALQYLAAEAILAAAMWLICEATGLKLKYFVSAELVLALIFGIRLVLAFGSKKYVVDAEKSADVKYQGWQSLTTELKALQTRADLLPQGALASAAINHLYEAARYADPVGSPESAGLEVQIRDAVSALRYELGQLSAEDAQSIDRVLKVAQNTERLIAERDSALKIQKS